MLCNSKLSEADMQKCAEIGNHVKYTVTVTDIEILRAC